MTSKDAFLNFPKTYKTCFSLLSFFIFIIKFSWWGEGEFFLLSTTLNDRQNLFNHFDDNRIDFFRSFLMILLESLWTLFFITKGTVLSLSLCSLLNLLNSSRSCLAAMKGQQKNKSRYRFSFRKVESEVFVEIVNFDLKTTSRSE